MREIAPPDLVEKVHKANPEWTVEQWERWWCKRFRMVKDWSSMKRCDECTCERS